MINSERSFRASTIFRPPTRHTFKYFRTFTWLVTIPLHLVIIVVVSNSDQFLIETNGVNYLVFFDRICSTRECVSWSDTPYTQMVWASLFVKAVTFISAVAVLAVIIAEALCYLFCHHRRPLIVGSTTSFASLFAFMGLLSVIVFHITARSLPPHGFGIQTVALCALFLASAVWSTVMVLTNTHYCGADLHAEEREVQRRTDERLQHFRERLLSRATDVSM